jgi:hypothetical protein
VAYLHLENPIFVPYQISSVSYVPQASFPTPCLPLIDLFHLRYIFSDISYFMFAGEARTAREVAYYPGAMWEEDLQPP